MNGLVSQSERAKVEIQRFWCWWKYLTTFSFACDRILLIFTGNSVVSWRKRHSPGQAYQTLGTRGVPCVLWQTRRRWRPPVLLWDCQGVCCIILCNHGYQVLPSGGVGKEEGEGVTHPARDTFPVFASSRERTWTKVEILWFWQHRFRPGGGRSALPYLA